MKPRLLSTARLSFPLATAIAALVAGPSVHADQIWDGGGANDNWNTAENWGGDVLPTFTSPITFTGNTRNTPVNDLAADSIIGGINLTNDGSVANANAFTLSGASITLGGNISTTANTTGATITDNISQNLILNANRTITTNQLSATVQHNLTLSGVISQTGGNHSLTKTGAGTLTLNGSAVDTFTGGLNVNGGTLTLDYANLATPTNLVDATNALQINNGALTITGRNVAAATTAQTFASTSLGAGVNAINIAKGALATSATLNLGALTVASGSSTTFSPTTAWTTTASATEKVFISAGGSVPSLPAGATTAFVNAGMFHRVAGGVTAGTLRLAAVNSSGQLLLKTQAGNLAAGTGADPTNLYQFNLATNLQLTDTAASIYGLLLNATSSGVSIIVANSGTLTLNSILQIKASEIVNINAGTGVSNVVIGSEKNLVIAMDNTAGFGIGAPIANNGSTGGIGGTASALTIAGTNPAGNPGTVTLGGANTYSGATTITRGTLSLGNVLALQNTSGLTLGGTSGATLSTSTTGIVFSAPITTANTGITSTIAFGRSTSATGSLTLNGAIGGNGNVIFTTPNVSSGGNLQTIIIGAAGTYAGNTTISTGNINNAVTIRAGVVNALPTTTILTVDGGNGPSGAFTRAITYELNGFNQTLVGLTNNTTRVQRNQRVNNASGTTATLTINNTANFSYGSTVVDAATTTATITGNLNLVKNGSGTQTLTDAANTFTGTTTVLGGILSLGHTGSLTNSACDTTSSSTGDATNGLRTTVTALTMGGLTGNKNLANVFTTTSGGYTGLTALTLNPGTGVTNSYAADIGDGAGGMNLAKTGAGTQILTAAQTYSGNTTVTAGTLTLSNAPDPLNANTGNDASTVNIAATGATLDLSYAGTDIVDKLFIGGVQQAAGVYGPTGINVPQITNSSGTGTLTVATGPAGYPAWASLNGAGLNLNDDHDNDGVDNGTEYFIGGPTGNTTGFTPLPGVTNTAGVLSVTWTKAANYTGIYGTDFSVETSATLTGVWATESSPGTVTISGNNVTYTFPAGTINFARLKVTGP